VALERLAGTASFIDVLDRVLDKRVVVDARWRVSLVGIEMMTINAFVIVGSCESDLKHPETLGWPPRDRIAWLIPE
jgi:gas vesicle structural protein